MSSHLMSSSLECSHSSHDGGRSNSPFPLERTRCRLTCTLAMLVAHLNCPGGCLLITSRSLCPSPLASPTETLLSTALSSAGTVCSCSEKVPFGDRIAV